MREPTTFTRRSAVGAGLAAFCAACTQLRTSGASSVAIAASEFPLALANPFMGLTLPSTMVLDALYDTLTLLDSDGAAVPALAYSWQQLDQLRWRFDLREDGRFFDGSPIDAAAIVDIVALLTSNVGRQTSAGSDLAALVEARAVGRWTVDFRLSSPMPLFPAALSVLRLPDPAAFRRLGVDRFAVAPQGSGAFSLVDWQPARILLTPRTSHWRRPSAQDIEVLLISDRTSRLQALLSGAVDVAMELVPDDAQVLRTNACRLASRMTTSVLLINFISNRGGPLADRRVREALNLAIDRERLIRAFMPGATVPAHQFAADDSFGRSPDIPPIEYNPQRARRLLAESGIEDRLPLTLVAAVGASGTDSAIYQQIAIDLAAIGVDLTIRRIPTSVLRQHLYFGDWPGDMFALRMGGYDALRSFRLAACEWQSPWRCDKEVSRLVAQASATSEIEERRALTRAALVAEREQFGAIYLWQEPSFDGLADSVQGWKASRATLRLEDLRAG